MTHDVVKHRHRKQHSNVKIKKHYSIKERRIDMKKLIALGIAAVMAAGITSTVFAGSFEGKQTARACLDQDGKEVLVIVDLSDGYSVEFVPGAVYLYDGPNDDGVEAVAIGLTIDEEVYNDYLRGAEDQPNYRTEDGITFYTEEDGTQDYFFEAGEGTGAFFMISVDSKADGNMIMSRFAAQSTGIIGEEEPGEEEPVPVSEVFTETDINDAMGKILETFNEWNGCELHDLRFAGDEFNNEENIAWMNELGNRDDFTQCIQFTMNFHSPVNEEDLEGTAWEADHEYIDYEWWLARTEGGEWELMTWGY